MEGPVSLSRSDFNIIIIIIIITLFNYKLSSNMFRPRMRPSWGSYKQEYNYNKCVRTIQPLKINMESKYKITVNR
jgi:hypothetical protein